MTNILTQIQSLARRFAREDRGTQVIEAAITLPILALLLATAAEFGRFFYTYTALAKATRASARYISTKPYTTAYINDAKDIVVCGKITCSAGDPTTVKGLSASQVEVIGAPDPTACVPHTVTVRLKTGTGGYQFQTIFNIGSLSGGSVSLNGLYVKPSVTMRYLLSSCTSPPAPAP